jgi:hypothetical protein
MSWMTMVIKKIPHLATQVLADDGSYRFYLSTLSTKFNGTTPSVPMVITITGCTTGVYSRPITAAELQDVSVGSTMLSLVLNTNSKDKMTLALKNSRTDVADLISTLSTASSLSAAYTLLNSNTANSSKFNSIFSVTPTSLVTASPDVTAIVLPTSANELSTLSTSVTTTHWSNTYQPAYQWKWDNVEVGTSATLAYALGANTQGTHLLVLKIGEDNGAGAIDTTKPLKTYSQSVVVNNSTLPTPPSFSVTAPTISGVTPITTRQITVTLATGASMANCASFTSLALTDNSATAPGPRLLFLLVRRL